MNDTDTNEPVTTTEQIEALALMAALMGVKVDPETGSK